MRRDKADAAGALGATHPEVEEVAEQRNIGRHPHKRLAVEGEDRQKEDGVGIKMKGVDLVMVEDGVEEIGEGGG